ncbi:MAG TPA: S8 family serine peptidase [Thermoanaerobaculia bacterium]|nr:S8 family serine peptidase [Thermoanaerobaculia bacterium]HUM29080.1 S8 family serine peptidase [Thermoanaerobaculia bacterium]HXK67364.1 S8 family serine peptidase [Thermoanaerobaculia bacterium]
MKRVFLFFVLVFFFGDAVGPLQGFIIPALREKTVSDLEKKDSNPDPSPAQALKILLEKQNRPSTEKNKPIVTLFDPLSVKDNGTLKANPDLILFRAGVFDPVVTIPSEIDFGLTCRRDAGTGPYLYIAQFNRTPGKSDKDHLNQIGAEVLYYIPNNAYILRLKPEQIPTVEKISSIRALFRLPKWAKIDPLIWTTMKDPVQIEILTAPGRDGVPVHRFLRHTFQDAEFMTTDYHHQRGCVVCSFSHDRLYEFLDTCSDLEDVLSMILYEPPELQNDHSIWVGQSYDWVNNTDYDVSATIWNQGILGTGQIVCVADGGLDTDMCFFRYNDSIESKTFPQFLNPPETGLLLPGNKVIAYYVQPGADEWDLYYFHGTRVSGSAVGDNYLTLSTPTYHGHDTGDGMAPNAQLVFQDVTNSSGFMAGLMGDLTDMFSQAYSAGARIHNDSWGLRRNAYYADALDMDEFMFRHEDFLFVVAMGNAGANPGDGTISVPATAKNVVSVGSTTNGGLGTLADDLINSSRGPVFDGRRKPDLVAPGEMIVSALGTESNVDDNCSTWSHTGSSYAAPTVSGLLALMRQYFMDGFYPTGSRAAENVRIPSGALLKACLINGAVPLGGIDTLTSGPVSTIPSNDQGWGRVHLDNVLYFTGDSRRLMTWDVRNANGLSTGEQVEYRVNVTSSTEPLEIHLVWTDPESTTLAAVNLVNNLDLEVVDPGGSTTYLGNVFSGGASTTGGSADFLNPVEGVLVPSPTTGMWTLRVKATAVNGTGTAPYSNRQGYALVATFADCASTISTPTGLNAVDTEILGIDLSWNSVAGATGYLIYRADGSSPDPEEYTLVGSTTFTNFEDTLVQGGYTYTYTVRAVDGCTESAASDTASATFSGACALRPDFAGLQTVINNTDTEDCELHLSWDPASSNCPQGPSVSYNIYRGTTPYFILGPGNLLQPGFRGTSYTDRSVNSHVTYYYVVRAEDSTTSNGGPANGGNESFMDVERPGTAWSSSMSPGTWADDGGDTGAKMTLSGEWHITNLQNHTGGGHYSYSAARDGQRYPRGACAAITTPPLELQPDSNPLLSYWVKYNIHTGYDGVVVEISMDGGNTWVTVNPNEFYPSSFYNTQNPPRNACGYPSAQKCFSGPAGNAGMVGWANYTHNLSPFAGQTVLIRWNLSSDDVVEFEGFFLDDIEVTFASVNEPCYRPIGSSLPQTGQTTCYNEAGAQISCTGTGQDGEFRAGIPWPDPRFTDNGDGTVTDELTGLIWLADCGCFSPSSWLDALISIAALANNQCGLSDGSQAGDWRLPNVLELESLYNSGVFNSANWLNTQGFSYVVAGKSATSTAHPYSSGSDFTVDMAWGYVDAGGGGPLLPVRGISSLPARLWRTGVKVVTAEGDDGDLRAGAIWPDPRFTDNGDGTATDNLTGLIWLKNTNCAGTGRTWITGFSDVNQLNTDGTMNGNNCQDTSNGGSHQTDWRVPNRKEIISLVDYSRLDGLPENHPFINLCSDYWTSTTFRSHPDWGWYFTRSLFLTITETSKTSSLCIWPVRTGYKTLTISKTGTGNGTVTSNPLGIDCGGICSGFYMQDVQVSLSAEAESGSEFIAWGGDCDASGHVVVDGDKTCTATFNGICTLTVDVTPNGTTTVCGGDSIVFAANLTGGTESFTYQWTEDGDDIPGATNPTYTASYVTAQSHDYNCKVSDSWCCVDIMEDNDSTGEWVTKPGSPSIAAISDDDDCAQSGVTISFVAGVDALCHDLVVDDAVVATGINSPHQHDPGDTVSHTYVVRAVNGDCEEDSEAQLFTDQDNSIGAPAITGITDNDDCAQDGVTITFTPGTGADSHDLWVDGNEVDTGITSPVVFDPGDTLTHVYIVCAVSASCTADSTGYPFADVDDTPVPPGPPIVTDSCGGLMVSWMATPPAISYNVYRRTNGCGPNNWGNVATGLTGTSWEDTGVSLGTEYGYYIEAFNDCGTVTDGRFACGEAFNTIAWPGVPSITSVNDALPGSRTGLLISFLGGSGAQSHDLWMDGHEVATGITSPYLYNPGNCSVHSFVVRAMDGICTTSSAPQIGQDDGCESGTPPPMGDGGTASGNPMTMEKDGDFITYSYDSTTCYSNAAVMLYGALGTFTAYTGTADCDGDGTFDAGSLGNVWFNLVWVNMANTAGHPGYDGDGLARGLEAAGVGCGILGDDPGDGVCD